MRVVDQPVGPHGHSVGGLNVEAFARRRPDQVAELVLIDASDPALHTLLDSPSPFLVDGAEQGSRRVSLPADPERVQHRATGRWSADSGDRQRDLAPASGERCRSVSAADAD